MAVVLAVIMRPSKKLCFSDGRGCTPKIALRGRAIFSVIGVFSVIHAPGKNDFDLIRALRGANSSRFFDRLKRAARFLLLQRVFLMLLRYDAGVKFDREIIKGKVGGRAVHIFQLLLHL